MRPPLRRLADLLQDHAIGLRVELAPVRRQLLVVREEIVVAEVVAELFLRRGDAALRLCGRCDRGQGNAHDEQHERVRAACEIGHRLPPRHAGTSSGSRCGRPQRALNPVSAGRHPPPTADPEVYAAGTSPGNSTPRRRVHPGRAHVSHLTRSRAVDRFFDGGSLDPPANLDESAMRLTRVLSVALVSATLAAPLAAQVPADAAASVDRIFERWTAQTPGCAVGVSREGRIVLARAYGMADLEHDVRNSPQTIFEAGSVSKQFTAAAIVMLALDGKLSLDDEVRKYIPELPDYGKRLTIRHMMNHTSGLRDWGSVASISGWGRGSRVHSHAHVLDIVSRQRGLNFDPGHEYSYSNTGYNLQAVIVERVSGMTFAEFSRERIFEPIGMKNTQWRDDYTRIVKGRATAYSTRGEGFALSMPFENVHGNGGLLTTVEDLLIWTENLETGRVGGPRFLQLTHEQGVLNNGEKISYASGLQVGALHGVPQVSHNGSTAGYRAFL